MLDPSGDKEVKSELDECKKRITAHLQRDVDVSTLSEAELEDLAGPDIMYVITFCRICCMFLTHRRHDTERQSERRCVGSATLVKC
jgi:hypothetical protein